VKNELGGVGIVSGYGLTECPYVSWARVDDPDDKLSMSEGRPPGESRALAAPIQSPAPCAACNTGWLFSHPDRCRAG
jgi:hypothetical protein